MKSEQDQVGKAARNIAKELKKETAQNFETVAGNIIEKGIIPAEALGLDEQMLEGIYGQAYRLYNTGKYQEAAQLFRLLIMVDSMEGKYSMGLAACYHMLKEYKNAVDAYTMCSIIDPNNPLPQYHASDCYIQMKDDLSAVIALELAIKRAGTQEQYHTLIDRSKMMIDSLKQKIKKELEEA